MSTEPGGGGTVAEGSGWWEDCGMAGGEAMIGNGKGGG